MKSFAEDCVFGYIAHLGLLLKLMFSQNVAKIQIHCGCREKFLMF